MRISSQNSQFLFNLPIDVFHSDQIQQLRKLMLKNFVAYDSPLSYLNSTIKDITLPGLTGIENPEQIKKYGKKIYHTQSKNIFDTYGNEVTMTFRSVDSNLNYMMMNQIVTGKILDTRNKVVPVILVEILDKDGDSIYRYIFEECRFNALSELSLQYNTSDVSEKTFTTSFIFNKIDILWNLDDEDVQTSKSIFDVPIYF